MRTHRQKNDPKLLWAMLLCALYALVLPALYPPLRLTFFAPLLILMLYQKSLSICLWAAFGIGFFLDLLSTDTRLGLYSLNYCLTTFILFNGKQLFFEEMQSAVPVMTTLFGLFSTGIQVVLLFAFNKSLELSWDWIGTDLVAMPLLDGLYAFIGIMLPLLILEKRKRQKSYR